MHSSLGRGLIALAIADGLMALSTGIASADKDKRCSKSTYSSPCVIKPAQHAIYDAVINGVKLLADKDFKGFLRSSVHPDNTTPLLAPMKPATRRCR